MLIVACAMIALCYGGGGGGGGGGGAGDSYCSQFGFPTVGTQKFYRGTAARLPEPRDPHERCKFSRGSVGPYRRSCMAPVFYACGVSPPPARACVCVCVCVLMMACAMIVLCCGNSKGVCLSWLVR